LEVIKVTASVLSWIWTQWFVPVNWVKYPNVLFGDIA
jgi:hypothetical protein